MLDEGLAESLNDIAKMENLSRARVTQIMDLLKLPAEVKEFLTGLQDPAGIRRYSERRLRNNQTSKVMLKELNNQKV
jgi:ParB-like chromosome segregation protein Spo0J